MKTKIKNSVRFIFVFLSLPLILATSLWPHDVHAFELGVERFNTPLTRLSFNNNTIASSDTNYFNFTNLTASTLWSPTFRFQTSVSDIPHGAIGVLDLTFKSQDVSAWGRNMGTNIQVSCPQKNTDDFTILTCNLDSSISNTNQTSIDGSGSGITSIQYTTIYNMRVYFRYNKDFASASQLSFSGNLVSLNGSNNVSITTSNLYIYDSNYTLEQLFQLLQDDSTSQKIDDARNEAQDAQTQTDSDGSASSSDADSDGQTLLQAFSSFIGAINVQAGSCNIDMDTGYVDFGVVNLCQLSPPPAFQAISSIVVIGFAVPLSLACARKIIDLFRSFQN